MQKKQVFSSILNVSDEAFRFLTREEKSRTVRMHLAVNEIMQVSKDAIRRCLNEHQRNHLETDY